MRSLLAFLISIIVIALIILYFLPGTVHLEKTMVLKAQSQMVFQEINTISEWKNWATWLKQDPINEITYHGPADAAGATLEWTSQVPEINTGNIILESSQEPTQVKAAIQFNKYGRSENNYILANTGNGTKVTWTLDMNIAEKGFPAGWINKIKALSWKKTIDTWMDESLKNLDEVTATAVYHRKPTANDTLVNKLDTLTMKVDSLKKINKEKDTIYP
jgi:hypothetical protein